MKMNTLKKHPLTANKGN